MPSTAPDVARARVPNTLAYSPFLALTTGESTCIFVPSGSAITASMIWSMVCWVIGLPHFGQCGRPMRAQSRRR